MKIEVNKKTMISISVVIFLLSALIYNLLYINNKKNEIIGELEIEEAENAEVEEIKTIFIDIGGEVINPGLYELPENSRINDAIKISGGVTDKADLTNVNLAYVLSDAIKIIIPKKEVKKVSVTSKSKEPIVATASILSEDEQQGSNKVNINNATVNRLKTLTGIGETTAQKIIKYRNENGRFEKIEEIKNVSGIGDSKYEKIKDKISV